MLNQAEEQWSREWLNVYVLFDIQLYNFVDSKNSLCDFHEKSEYVDAEREYKSIQRIKK